MRLRFSTRAERDLDEIYAFVKADRPMAASKILARIKTSSNQLRSHPYMGRSGSVAGTRELVVRGLPYIIVYRVDEDGAVVMILNVVHGARRR